MKKSLIILLTVLCVFSTSSCLKGDEVNQEVVEMSDIKIDDDKDAEVIINDAETEKRLPSVPTFGESPSETNYTDKDGSTVNVSYDGAGNKTEVRNFFNHPNIKMLKVTVSADGSIKEGIVYGHNNEHKIIPPDLVDKALTISGSDIAYKVGITTTKIVGAPVKAQPNQVYNPSAPVYTYIPDPRREPGTLPVQPQPEEPQSAPTPENKQPSEPQSKDDDKK